MIKKRSKLAVLEKDELAITAYGIYNKLKKNKKSKIELSIFKKNWQEIKAPDVIKLLYIGYTLLDVRQKYNVSSLEIISEPLKSNGFISSLHEKKKIITMKIIKPLINLYKIK